MRFSLSSMVMCYMMSGPNYKVQRYVSASPDSSTLTVLPFQASPYPPFSPFRLPDAASDQRLVVAHGGPSSTLLTECKSSTAMLMLIGLPWMVINRSCMLTGPPGMAGVPGSVTRITHCDCVRISLILTPPLPMTENR